MIGALRECVLRLTCVVVCVSVTRESTVSEYELVFGFLQNLYKKGTLL
jgi:hypothetical protein